MVSAVPGWYCLVCHLLLCLPLVHPQTQHQNAGPRGGCSGGTASRQANTRARGKSKYDHELILRALGGKENIESLDNCITRLRLVVKDMGLIDQQALKAAGALSVVMLDAHSVQVIIGPQVQGVKTGIEALI